MIIVFAKNPLHLSQRNFERKFPNVFFLLKSFGIFISMVSSYQQNSSSLQLEPFCPNQVIHAGDPHHFSYDCLKIVVVPSPGSPLCWPFENFQRWIHQKLKRGHLAVIKSGVLHWLPVTPNRCPGINGAFKYLQFIDKTTPLGLQCKKNCISCILQTNSFQKNPFSSDLTKQIR